MPEGVEVQDSKIEGAHALFSFAVYEKGGMTITLALPGQQELGQKTYDLTETPFLGSLQEIVTTLVLGLVVGLAPEVDA